MAKGHAAGDVSSSQGGWWVVTAKAGQEQSSGHGVAVRQKIPWNRVRWWWSCRSGIVISYRVVLISLREYWPNVPMSSHVAPPIFAALMLAGEIAILIFQDKLVTVEARLLDSGPRIMRALISVTVNFREEEARNGSSVKMFGPAE
jgi:hypothetical protein